MTYSVSSLVRTDVDEREKCDATNNDINVVTVTEDIMRSVFPANKEADTRVVESVANTNTCSSRGAASGASGARIANVPYSRVGRLDKVTPSGDRERSDNEQVPTDVYVSSDKERSTLDVALRGYLIAEYKDMAASDNRDGMSGESLSSLSTSEIVERSRAIRERIAERLRMADKRREVIETYRVLCLADSKISRDPAFTSDSQQCRGESV